MLGPHPRSLVTRFGVVVPVLLASLAACASCEGDVDPRTSGSGTEDPAGGPGNFDKKDEAPGSGQPSEVRDPTTCAEALATRSYVGCDYWPAITPNGPSSKIFHFAAVVANNGATEASVTVTGPNATNVVETVPPGELKTLILPWVPELKGPDAVGWDPKRPKGAMVSGGAYHLVSSVPITVYHFNALEFQVSSAISYSNDASLLLPSTAMRNVYRVTGLHGLGAGVHFVAAGPLRHGDEGQHRRDAQALVHRRDRGRRQHRSSVSGGDGDVQAREGR